ENFEKLHGFDEGKLNTEHVMQTLVEHIHPEDRGPEIAEIINIDNIQVPSIIVFRSLGDDGKTRWIERTVGLWLDENTLLGTVKDITKEKEAESRLLEQTQTITLGEDVANLSSWVFNVEENTLHTTPQFEKMLQFEPGTLTPENTIEKWAANIHPEDQERVMEVQQRIHEIELPYFIDYRYILPSEEIIWLRENIGLWLEKGRLMGTIQDVTRTKKIELQLKEQNEMIRLGEEVSNLCSWILDVNTMRTEFTPRFEKIHGFPPGSLTPEDAMIKCIERINSKDVKMVQQTLENVRDFPVPSSIEYRMTMPSGEKVWLRDTLGMWLDESRVMGTTQDITKQKKIDLQLAQQYQRSSLGEVVANMSSMIIDFKTNRTEISDQFLKMFGFDPNVVNPDNAMEMYTKQIHPDDRPVVLQMIAEIVARERPLPTTQEYRFMHPDGHIMWIKGTIGMWINSHAVVGTSQDITYLKDNELVLKKQNQTNELAEEVAKMCSWVVDATSMEAEISSRFLEMFEMDPEQCTPSNVMGRWMQNVHPEDIETVQQEVQGIVTKQIPIPRTKEYRYVLPSGRTMWVRCTFGVWLDETKIVGSTIDITEEKEQDLQLQALNHQVERQKELLVHGENVSKIGTWTWNKTTNSYSFSQGLHKVFHVAEKVFTTENVLPQIKRMVHPEDLETVQAFHQAARDNILDSGSELVYRIITPKEKIVWIQFTVGGWVEQVELIGVCQDITTAKRAEEKLLHTQQELEQLVYSVSHDLRAPVRHVEAFASKIYLDEANHLSDTGNQLLSRVKTAAGQLGSKIDDLLAYSRSRTEKLDKQLLDLNQLIDPIIQNIKAAHSNRKIEWDIDSLPSVVADRNLMESAFQNLIGNAIKYTSKKDISTIRIKAKKLPGFWQFEIHDNGAGFDMKYASKLFQPFQRLHTQREFMGNGIGLANVHRIITRHKGKIWAEGHVEKGASFFFTLPVS
ncbi:MAG: PAS domain-containing protein, partial [Bacteroidota bacterium]